MVRTLQSARRAVVTSGVVPLAQFAVQGNPGNVDPVSLAFRNALSGIGVNPVVGGNPGASGEQPAEIPESQRGMRLESKCIDMTYDPMTRQFVSQERKPHSIMLDKYAEYAFTLHRTLDPSTTHKAYFEIRSQYLRNVFEATIGSVAGISWTAKPLRVDYQIFIIYLEELHAALLDLMAAAGLNNEAAVPPEGEDVQESDEVRAHRHLSFFLSFLRTEYASTLAELSSLLEHGEITFDYLWAILKPRSLLYARCSLTSKPRAVRLHETNRILNPSGSSSWQLNVEYVDYNSQYGNGLSNGSKDDPGHPPKFGLVTWLMPQQIMYFKGARKITSLDIYPLNHCPQLDDLKSLLIARGRKWASLQGGPRHMQYKESGSDVDRELKLLTTERIIIDREKYGTYSNGSPPGLHILQVTKTLDGNLLQNSVSLGSVNANNDFYDMGEAPESPNVEETELTEDDLLIADSCLYAYNFSTKRWAVVAIDSVQPIDWNDEPFANLVLSGNQKMLVKALVETHYATDEMRTNASYARFDDFVQGKGQGLVINLYGNPGVGKTLTAEAMSEHVRKPLMSISAADLGTSAASVEKELTWAFKMAARWRAVVLIDEADVFLEARSLHDLERNALVAVFLRYLEYFRGILFLTTNRVRSIDPAFQSRIHVSLRYRDLSADARRAIWVAFLTKSRGTFTGADEAAASRSLGSAVASADFGHGLSERELKLLSEHDVNGRQIKNAVRTASALAASMGEMLAYKHLESVLEMMADFEAEMSAARNETL